jgi:hypothetical protein
MNIELPTHPALGKFFLKGWEISSFVLIRCGYTKDRVVLVDNLDEELIKAKQENEGLVYVEHLFKHKKKLLKSFAFVQNHSYDRDGKPVSAMVPV